MAHGVYASGCIEASMSVSSIEDRYTEVDWYDKCGISCVDRPS